MRPVGNDLILEDAEFDRIHNGRGPTDVLPRSRQDVSTRHISKAELKSQALKPSKADMKQLPAGIFGSESSVSLKSQQAAHRQDDTEHREKENRPISQLPSPFKEAEGQAGIKFSRKKL